MVGETARRALACLVAVTPAVPRYPLLSRSDGPRAGGSGSRVQQSVFCEKARDEEGTGSDVAPAAGVGAASAAGDFGNGR